MEQSKKKIITTKDKKGVLPSYVVKGDKKLGFMSKKDSVLKLAELNAASSLSVNLANGDEQAFVAKLEQLGYDVKKKTEKVVEKQPEAQKSLGKMNKKELTDVANAEGLELAEDMTNKDIIAVIEENRK